MITGSTTITTTGLVLLAGLVGCASSPAPAPAPAVKSAPAAQPRVEPQAARVAAPVGPIKVVLPRAGDPIVSIRLLFRAGSADDPPGQEGATALAAQLMVEGGTQRLSAAELQRALFPMAAELRVQVDKEMTVFLARVHRDHLERFLPILTDVLLRPRWDERELLRLRADALNDITKRLRTADDETLGKEALSALLYGGLPGGGARRHPYAHYVGGSVAGLKGLTVEKLRAHAARVFTRGRLMIGVAGGIGGTEDPAVVALERALVGEGGLPADGAPVPAVAPPVLPTTRLLVVEKQAPATAISLGFPVRIRRAHPDFYALMLAVSVLGEHRQFGGRLFERLRGKRGLNYGDYAYLEHFVQDGWSTFGLPNVGRQQQAFTIWIRPVEHRNRLFALRAALFELDRFVKEGITEEELERTRGFLLGYTLLWEQTMSRRLGYALDDVYYGTSGFLRGLREKLPRLTRAEVNAAIKRHLDPSQLRIAVVTRDATSLVEEVLGEKPSPITYATPPTDPALLAEDRTIERWRLGLRKPEIQVLTPRQLF